MSARATERADQTTLDSSDGLSYTLVLPSDLATAETYQHNGLTWRYEGQQSYLWSPGTVTEYDYVVPEYVLTGLGYAAEEYLGVGTQYRTDEYGRRWVLESVNLEALEERIAEYDARVSLSVGVEPDANDDGGIVYPENAGEHLFLEARAWVTADDCDSDSAIDIEVLDGDNFSASPTPLNSVRKKVVAIMKGPNFACSGTLVDERWVLTAAHCVTQSDGSPLNNGVVTTCTRGNVLSGAVCYDTVEIVVKGGTWDGTTAEDAALVKLQTTDTGEGWMALSEASDAVLDDHPHYHRGFPSWTDLSCSSNITSDDGDTIDDDYQGASMQDASGEFRDGLFDVAHYDTTSGNGMSGGPHYYCPNGPCATDGHWITGVESSFHWGTSTNSWQQGPLARSIKSWVLANI